MTYSGPIRKAALAGVLVLLPAAPLSAHGITAAAGNAAPALDIVGADIATEGRIATVTMSTKGTPGADHPEAAGGLAGAPVFSYARPTTVDPATVGFEAGAGLLALVVTIHPDVDDTPLFDEGSTGATDDDGGFWHSHWGVPGPGDACGAGALKVIDIPDGAAPALPLTWPGLPLLIDSPGCSQVLDDATISVRLPFADIGALEAARFDGVTAALRVNANLHAALLCVTDVFDVASGDLSLPDRVRK
jgi:hypothetical protein